MHLIGNPNYELVKGDIRDEEIVKKTIPKADVIIHLAAIVGYPACAKDPVAAKTTNEDGTINIARHVSKSQRLIYASTGSSYGILGGICTEESATNPLSIYGRTKLSAEKPMLDAGAVVYRFSTMFGVSPSLRLTLLPNDFTWRAANEKVLVLFEANHRRTFLAVQDCARSYLHGITSEAVKAGEIYNVGNEKLNLTKSEVAHKIAKLAPCHIHEADVGSDADKRDYEVSYKKFYNTGYYATRSLEDGVRELLKVVPYLKREEYI